MKTVNDLYIHYERSGVCKSEQEISGFPENLGRCIFLMSSGYLPGAHQPDCPVYPRILAAHPRWLERENDQ